MIQLLAHKVSYLVLEWMNIFEQTGKVNDSVTHKDSH